MQVITDIWLTHFCLVPLVRDISKYEDPNQMLQNVITVETGKKCRSRKYRNTFSLMIISYRAVFASLVMCGLNPITLRKAKTP